MKVSTETNPRSEVGVPTYIPGATASIDPEITIDRGSESHRALAATDILVFGNRLPENPGIVASCIEVPIYRPEMPGTRILNDARYSTDVQRVVAPPRRFVLTTGDFVCFVLFMGDQKMRSNASPCLWT
eukprot:CAMPEP_0181078868 /NCGR_PEP_ID=MMETSP1071-20121207/1718_1 /TAXON_ID=35127 /ORGANISM="Thalassiosira sp., Strain NH16" /LENGTH=128 /DNA_ID=CAMNT_0023160217 /DNA_START=77 /DNA_END=460 /DNA_ORIENTATION=+